MEYSAKNIATILNIQDSLKNENANVEFLCIDSRKISFPNKSLFFAINTSLRNGHSFINDVYLKGCRNFVVEKSFNSNDFTEANFFKVNNVIEALQKLVSHHRSQFNIPIIAITGSNGKTIVKEWLNQMLAQEFNIVRSPASYNSQIGVPLSVWQINKNNNLGIFEAGISTKNEMQHLTSIIKPTISVLTNIGTAHHEGFENLQEKLQEKLKLFSTADVIIFPGDNELIYNACSEFKNKTKLSWGYNRINNFRILKIEKNTSSSTLTFLFNHQESSFSIPFIDDASIENAITCCCVVLSLNYSVSDLQKLILEIHPIAMRMQYYKAINNCTVINDSYSFDVNSFLIALNFLDKQLQQNKTVILSDLPNDNYLQPDYQIVINYLNSHAITKCIFIGQEWEKFFNSYPEKINFAFSHYTSTKQFINQVKIQEFKNEAILLKAARSFEFEKINQLFELKVHQTILEINLTAVTHNIKQVQSKLKPGVMLMAMVKAFGYGSGSVDVAQLLQFHKVHYLAVAYTDEAIELRKSGIHLPILIMNVDAHSFKSIIQYHLEPEIYSFEILHSFIKHLQADGITHYPVHIKIDTGMHRLGFMNNEIDDLCEIIKNQNSIQVKSVFSHLVASEDEKFDDYTFTQKKVFDTICTQIETHLQYTFIKHISNSAAIFRHENLQLDMVRLGIGLYGIGLDSSLRNVLKLKTTIAQIKKVKKGECIGYGRKGVLNRDSKIATIRIGYADGFHRSLGNSVGKVFIKNQVVPVIGNVSMDMCMVDVTDLLDVQITDEVEIFGNHILIEQFSDWQGTIPYEALTSIGQRVKRVYYEE